MQHQPPARQGSNTVLVATLVAVSMTLLFVLLSFLFLRDSSGDAASDVTATTTTTVLGTPTTPVATTAAPAPPTTAAPAPQTTAAPAPQTTAAPAPQTTAAPAPLPPGSGALCGESDSSPVRSCTLKVSLRAKTPAYQESIELQAGDKISVQLSDLGGLTDPVLEIFDPSGNPIGYNDNIDGASSDASLTVVANVYGLYSIQYRSAIGAPSGQARLDINVN